MPSRPSARASPDSNTSNSQSPRFGGDNTSLFALLRRSLCLGGDSERVPSGQQQPGPSQAAHEQPPMPGPGPAAAAPRAAAQPAPMPAAAPPLPSPPTAPSTPAARPSSPVESPSHEQQQQQRQQEQDERMPMATRSGSAPLPAYTTPNPAARAAAAAAEGPTADTAWRDLDGDDEEQEEDEQQQQQHEQGPQIRHAPQQAWLPPAASGAAGAGPEAKPTSPNRASADTDVRALGVDDRHAGDQRPQPSATADAAEFEAAHPVTTAAGTAAAAAALARRASCPTLLPALPEAAYDPAARTAIPPVPSAVPPVPATSAHLWRSYPATQRSSDFLSAASMFINLASRFEGVRKVAYTSTTSPAPLLQLVPPLAPGQPTQLGPWSGLAAVPAATAVRAPSAPLAATTATAAVAAAAAGKAMATRTRAGAAPARLPLPLHEAQRAQRLHWAQQALRAQQVLKALRPPGAHTRRGASVPLMPVPPPALPDQSAPLSGQCSVNGAPAPHAEGQEPSALPPWRGLPAHAATQRYRTSSTTGSVGLAHAGLPSPAGIQGGPQAAEVPGATLARFRVMVQGVHQRSISGHPALATGGAPSAAPGHAYGPRAGVTASTPAMGARAGFADPNTAGARRAAAVRRSDVATLE